MRKMIFALVLFTVASQARAQQPLPSPAEICDATTGFLSAVNKGTVLSRAMGKLYESHKVADLEIRSYHSLQNFPGAVRTVIMDTNSLNRMRYVEVLLATETVTEARIKGKMEDALNYYIAQLQNCLGPLKYETDGDRAPGHEFTASFRLKLASGGSGLFQLPDFLQAQLYLTHKKNADGTFTNQLGLTFRRI